uniref:Uncharacterized protein n=1 Tax=Knipowitschia caucasica TaxID=637954 RepID=A0AAV2KN14_KNICA
MKNIYTSVKISLGVQEARVTLRISVITSSVSPGYREPAPLPKSATAALSNKSDSLMTHNDPCQRGDATESEA